MALDGMMFIPSFMKIYNTVHYEVMKVGVIWIMKLQF